MNYSSEILDFLARTETNGCLIVAPNAPPVIRTGDNILSVALHTVLDASDVMDTLAAFRAQAGRPPEEPYLATGTFTFGVLKVGRFRVSYITQRGSKMLLVTRVPFRIPPPEAVCDDTAAMARLLDFLLAREGGILAIGGPSAADNSLLVYSLLAKVNQQTRRIMYLIEPEMSFLMAHGDSVVIQSELGTDVPTLEEGLRSAALIDPDILYVGSVRSQALLPVIWEAFHPGMVGIISSVAYDARILVRTMRQTSAAKGVAPVGLPAMAVALQPATGGKFTIPYVEAVAAQ